MFAYGFLSVILALYLSALGYSLVQIGVLFTVALAGGAIVTAAVSLFADRWGRRRTLIVSGILMAVTGAALAVPMSFRLLLIFVALGTLSPSGQEIGPFQSLEQAALAATTVEPARVGPYAWYNLVGYLAVAIGALAAGAIPGWVHALGWTTLLGQRGLVWAFAAIGLALAGLYRTLSPSVEPPPQSTRQHTTLGLHRSRRVVLHLSALFGLDALAGGFIVQSLIAFWFFRRFGIGLEILGPLFFGTNLLSAVSSLVAAKVANRIGLLNTMVFTHLPSNVLLALVPLMPSWPLAAVTLLARHALSQMDVPVRQAYTMVLVAPDERAAAAGLTNAVRPAASSVAPMISGIVLQTTVSGLPFLLAGGLKIIYDLALWVRFRRMPIAEKSHIL
jgi:predicted MFS family arabinose efflux permease